MSRILPIVAGLLALGPSVASALPSFPGAEGFGTETPGGRFGDIVEVTNLADDGPGSLRDALELRTGPRIVVFRTGGTIELTRDIRITEPNSFVTVAGQTAPGDGIQLKNYGIVIRDGGHDVVIRHLRIRPGDTTPGIWDKDGILVWGNSGSHVHSVVIDHVSMQWAIDENANVWEWATDVTFQSCMFAEGSLTGHPNGGHGKGFLSGADSRQTITIHHSLFAHNDDRSPKVDGNSAGLADFRNNVIYNWGNNNCTKLDNGAQINVVGNVYVAGPDSSAGNERVLFVPDAGNATGVQIFVDDNLGPLCPNGCTNEWDLGVWYYDGAAQNAPASLYEAPGELMAPSVATQPADGVLADVLAHAGATLPVRDPVDARIVAEVEALSGAVGIGSAYPSLASGTPPADTDHDGMPDAWEQMFGLDPDDPEDRNGDLNDDGYTNVEEFLNGRDPGGAGGETSGSSGGSDESSGDEGGDASSGPSSDAGGDSVTSSEGGDDGSSPSADASAGGCTCRASTEQRFGLAGLALGWVFRRKRKHHSQVVRRIAD